MTPSVAKSQLGTTTRRVGKKEARKEQRNWMNGSKEGRKEGGRKVEGNKCTKNRMNEEKKEESGKER